MYCFFITIFRLAIPAFFRFTDVTELMIWITILYTCHGFPSVLYLQSILRSLFAQNSQWVHKRPWKKKERNCNGCYRYRRFDFQAQRSSTTSQVSFGLFTEAHPRSRFLDVTQRSLKRAGERCVTSKKRLRGRLRYKTLLRSRVTLNKEVNTIEPRKTKGAEQRQR